MARFTIDGRPFSGGRIHITERGEVEIDGVRQEGGLQGRIEIHVVEGVVETLKVAGDVRCGTVGGNVDAGGGVTCGNVGGNIDAGGSVTCGAVGGNVDAGGSVVCGDVHGSADAGGQVTVTRRS